MRIGGPGRARLSLVRQSPLLHGRFSFQDEGAGSSPARPTIPGLTCGNACPLSPPTVAVAVRRLRTAASERIPAVTAPSRVQVIWPLLDRVMPCPPGDLSLDGRPVAPFGDPHRRGAMVNAPRLAAPGLPLRRFPTRTWPKSPEPGSPAR